MEMTARKDMGPDEKLMVEVCSGSEEAFDELNRKYFSRLVGFLWRLGANEHAEDLAKETLYKAFDKCNLFDRGKGKLFTWLSTIARNTFLDHQRKKNRRNEVSLDVVDGKDPEGESWASQIPDKELVLTRYQSLLINKLLEILLDAIDELPENQREAIILHYIRQLSYSEAAEEMGTSVGAFKQLIYRARQNLSRILKPRIHDYWEKHPDENVDNQANFGVVTRLLLKCLPHDPNGDWRNTQEERQS